MTFYLSQAVKNDNLTVAYDFGGAGASAYNGVIVGAENQTIQKRVKVEVAIGTKALAGNVSFFLSELFLNPVTGVTSFVPVPQTVSAPESNSGDLTVRSGADDSTQTLSPGQILANGFPTAVTTGQAFVLQTTAPVTRQVFLSARATDAATMTWSANTFAEQLITQ